MVYWVFTWIVMAAAFTCAWAFIVKGCEAMDDKAPPYIPSNDDSEESPAGGH